MMKKQIICSWGNYFKTSKELVVISTWTWADDEFLISLMDGNSSVSVLALPEAGDPQTILPTFYEQIICQFPYAKNY